jgi:hypothetical protein
VRTLYACLGENDGELSFEPNQIITNGKFLLLLMNLKEIVFMIHIVEVICWSSKKRNCCIIIKRGWKLTEI